MSEECGMLRQKSVSWRQREAADYWLEYGKLWDFERQNARYTVLCGGCIQQEGKKERWIETEEILAVAYDPVAYTNRTLPTNPSVEI